MTEHSSRLLSIGEFAAATQLTPKALRLYDEQRILAPASIDAANGYRYYASSQVPAGRLIRTLREMDLPLTEIAAVLAADGAQAQMLLKHFAQELDRRFAREKRAFQSALMLMRAASRSDVPSIGERERPAMTVVVGAFAASREHFIERYRAELSRTRNAALQAGLSPLGESYCALVEPLSHEAGRLECLLSVASPAEVSSVATLRHMPAAPCAVMTASPSGAHASEVAAAFDALFDWFDQRGYRAQGSPLVSIEWRHTALHAEILWAYEPAANRSDHHDNRHHA
ncbi:MAG: MerR family transcriptional regulator [Steroidobacter sp.]